LGVNIDHVATLRQVRGTPYPDPFDTLAILKKCRVDQVTLHLREDRRHIQDHDLQRVIQAKVLPVNLEMAATSEMVKIACDLKPSVCTFVPEKRRELTTEGGLNLRHNTKTLLGAIETLQKKKICVSLFVEADPEQIWLAARLGADAVEIHTGFYCDQAQILAKKKEVGRITTAARWAKSLGLAVYAGHGLHVGNLAPIVAIPEIEEYNIGHAIIARAIFVGLETAIVEIQNALQK
jgi:pyridoxine 5-phosphate synthase